MVITRITEQFFMASVSVFKVLGRFLGSNYCTNSGKIVEKTGLFGHFKANCF